MNNAASTSSPSAIEKGVPLPIDGTSRVYTIIGDPIAQVGSPTVFNTLFREAGFKAALVPFHVEPAALGQAMQGFRALRNLDGIIVTVPHKVAILPFLDELGPNAARIGAVNAIRREPDGRLLGENFDGKGCVIGLERQGHDLTGRKALVVGAGGAGSAVAHALADAGVAAMTVFDVDGKRRDALVESLNRARPDLDAQGGDPDPTGHDLVVNCSPVGMHADDPYPIDPERLVSGSIVVDVILKPRVSRFLEAAEKAGCAIQPGYRMLEGQAEAIATFFGVK